MASAIQDGTATPPISMTEWAHKRVVLLALQAARSVGAGIEWKLPSEVAKATSAFMPLTTSGRRQPMGERRVRTILNEVVAEGYATRQRRFYVGNSYRLTDEGAKVK